MKRILCLLISTIMIISSMGIVGSAADYNGHWAQSSIDALISDGVVSGDTSGSVRPDDNITRGEFVKVINKYFGYSEKATANFADIDSSKWYADEFLIAKQAGYITGDQNGNANPEANITRAEVCVIMARILNLPNNYNITFNDSILVPDWARGAIGAMYANGLISGYADNTVRAEANITRAESFTLVVRNDRTAAGPSSQGTAVGGNISIAGGAGGGGGGGGAGGGYNPPFDADSNAASVSISGVNGKKVSFTASNAASFDIKVEVGGSEYNYANVAATTLSNGYEIDFTSVIAQTATTRQANREIYKMSVKAVGTTGYSDSAYAEFYNAMAIYDIAKPANLNAVYNHNGSAYEPNKYKLTWDTVANSSKYIVTVFKTNELKTEDILYTNANVASNSEIADLTAKTPQELEKAVFVVQAVINNVPSDYSASKQLLLDGPVITGVTYDSTERKYKVSYGAVAGATGYKARFNGVETAIDSDGNMSTLFVVPDDTVGVTGTVEVMAICDSNASGYTPYATTAIAFAGGAGTEADPYLIENIRHFKNICESETVIGGGKHFKQVANLSFGSTYQPSTIPFTGVYDGNRDGGFSITVTDITPVTSTDDLAIFNIVQNATIKNVVTNGSISNSAVRQIAGIAANAEKTTFINCENNISFSTSKNNVGGIAAKGYNCTFTNCVNNGTLAVHWEANGGILGRGYGTFTNCVNNGEISAQGWSGGIVGFVENGSATITNCSNRGAVKGKNKSAYYIGGIVGYAKGNVTIEKTYNSGAVSMMETNPDLKQYTASAVGGLLSANSVTINDFFNVGVISSRDNASAVGHVSTLGASVIINGYYDAANSSLEFISDPAAGIIVETNNAYILGDNITVDDLKTAITDGKFSSEIWETGAATGYDYPTIKGNPYAASGTIPPPSGGGESGGGGGGGTTPPTPPTPPTGPGSSASDPILIADADTFKSYFGDGGANNAKIDDGLYFKQTADITLGTYTPVNTVNFNGTYDADDKTINYTIASTANANGYGAFGRVIGGTIKNLTVAGTLTGSHNFLGGVAGYSDGATFINCTNEVAITSTNYNYIGGISGGSTTPTAASTFTNCVNNAAITARYGHCAGILASGFGTFTDCVNNATITAQSGGDYAGILCWATADESVAATASVTISQCVNTKDIKTGGSNSSFGGIIGNVKSVNTVSISESYNTGLIHNYGGEATTGPMIGKISDSMTGTNPSVTVNNCYSTGAINNAGQHYFGGAIGQQASTKATVTLSNYYDSYSWAFQWNLVGNVAAGATTPVLENAYTIIEDSRDPISANHIKHSTVAGQLLPGFSADYWVVPESGSSYPVLKNNPPAGVVLPLEPGASESNPILIADADTFKSYFAADGGKKAKIADGLYFKQNASFDLGTSYTPENTIAFNGTYDASGNTITYAITATNSNGTGAFGKVVGGTIKNLTVAGSLNSAGKDLVGGVAGYSDGATYINCTNTVAINGTSGGNYNGGIAGGSTSSKAAHTFTNCKNEANLSFKWGLNGGILGVGFGTFTDCVNNGSVNNASSGQAAGILCSASADVSVADTAFVTITRCINNGAISASNPNITNFIGGMIGEVRNVNTVLISESYNTGALNGNGTTASPAGLGPMIGCIYDAMTGESPSVTVANCYNTASWGDNGSTRNTGGAIGRQLSTNAAVTLSSYYDTFRWGFQYDMFGYDVSPETTVKENVYYVYPDDKTPEGLGASFKNPYPISQADMKAGLPTGFSEDVWVAVPDALPQLKCFTGSAD